MKRHRFKIPFDGIIKSLNIYSTCIDRIQVYIGELLLSDTESMRIMGFIFGQEEYDKQLSYLIGINTKRFDPIYVDLWTIDDHKCSFCVTFS